MQEEDVIGISQNVEANNCVLQEMFHVVRHCNVAVVDVEEIILNVHNSVLLVL